MTPRQAYSRPFIFSSSHTPRTRSRHAFRAASGAGPRGLRQRAGPEERHAHASASATGWANLPGNSEGPFAMPSSLSDMPRKSFAERLAIGTCNESFTPLRYHGAEPIAYGR